MTREWILRKDALTEVTRYELKALVEARDQDEVDAIIRRVESRLDTVQPADAFEEETCTVVLPRVVSRASLLARLDLQLLLFIVGYSIACGTIGGCVAGWILKGVIR